METTITVVDRLKEDDTNSTSLWSDTLQLINDFYTKFSDNECEYGFYMDPAASATRVYAEFDDRVNGYSCTFIVKIGNNRDETQIPII